MHEEEMAGRRIDSVVCIDQSSGAGSVQQADPCAADVRAADDDVQNMTAVGEKLRKTMTTDGTDLGHCTRGSARRGCTKDRTVRAVRRVRNRSVASPRSAHSTGGVGNHARRAAVEVES